MISIAQLLLDYHRFLVAFPNPNEDYPEINLKCEWGMKELIDLFSLTIVNYD